MQQGPVSLLKGALSSPRAKHESRKRTQFSSPTTPASPQASQSLWVPAFLPHTLPWVLPLQSPQHTPACDGASGSCVVLQSLCTTQEPVRAQRLCHHGDTILTAPAPESTSTAGQKGGFPSVDRGSRQWRCTPV
jgi:hypothetical protein